MRVVLIEDDLDIGRGIQLTLGGLRADVVWVRHLAAASALLEREDSDVVVLDLTLPDGDGIEWLKLQRHKGLTIPVLILSARDALHNRLLGLNSGADDYLVKPFSLEELHSRLSALVRRARGFASEEVQARGVRINPQAMTAAVGEVDLALSPTEFRLLLALVRHQGRVLTRMQLEERACIDAESASLDMHMSNLRRKVGAGIIRTVRGIGYAIDV